MTRLRRSAAAALIGAAAVALCAATGMAQEQLAIDGTLPGYLALAERASPALASAVARHEGALAKELRAGGLPDPVVSYGHYFEEVETRVGPQVNRLGVRQMLPWFGKLSLAEDAARERAAAAAEMVRATRLDVAVSVTRAFADYAYHARALEITEERLTLLRSLDDVVRSEYSSGGATYGDVMKAQVGLARIQDSYESLISATPAVSARLAASVGLAGADPLPLPEWIPDPPVRMPLPEDQAFEAHNPDLLALGHEVEAARYESELAGRSYFPDLTVGVDYIETGEALMPVEDSGKDPLIGVASLSVPLWFGKHKGEVDGARAALTAAERMKDQRTLELGADLSMAKYRLEDELRRVALYVDRIVPAAEQSVAASDASYRAGKADFDALISAHEMALESELSLARARADALVAASRLARLMGDDEWGRGFTTEGTRGDE